MAHYGKSFMFNSFFLEYLFIFRIFFYFILSFNLYLYLIFLICFLWTELFYFFASTKKCSTKGSIWCFYVQLFFKVILKFEFNFGFEFEFLLLFSLNLIPWKLYGNFRKWVQVICRHEFSNPNPNLKKGKSLNFHLGARGLFAKCRLLSF